MNPPTPDLLPLQLFLAKQLPEEIQIKTDDNCGYVCEAWFVWKVNAPNTAGIAVVTPREWDYIARRVEEKFWDVNPHDYHTYNAQIAIEAKAGLGSPNHVSAPWQTRATSLMKAKGE